MIQYLSDVASAHKSSSDAAAIKQARLFSSFLLYLHFGDELIWRMFNIKFTYVFLTFVYHFSAFPYLAVPLFAISMLACFFTWLCFTCHSPANSTTRHFNYLPFQHRPKLVCGCIYFHFSCLQFLPTQEVDKDL